MPASTHPRAPLKFGWSPRESGWGDDMNLNLVLIGFLLHAAVIDRDLDTPPGSPTEGDRYLVAATGTGAWAGHDGEIAIFYDGGWLFIQPWPGVRLYVEDDDAFIYFTASEAWASE